jgi:uncharacterized protein (TIGR03437 family)
MIGLGSAIYRPALTSATGSAPSFLALADFNGDGKLDAVITNSNSSTVSVLLGSGNGTFQPPVSTASGSGPAWIAVQDFNGDGKPDLVVANSTANTVVVLRQNSSTQPPSITGNSIGNAASYQSGTVAPGELVTIFGTSLGPSQLKGLQLDSSGRVANKLDETQVLFDGIAAPLIYVSAGQVGAVVPYEVSGSTQVQVKSSSGTSNTVTLSVADTVPGFFTKGSTGSGQGAIINQDGTVNSDANPASGGDIVLIYGTGEGQTNPMGIDGSVSGSNPPQLPASISVSATIGGKAASVKYDGAAPGFVAGVFQVNVKIPNDAGSGDLPVLVTIGNATTQSGVTVAVK